MQDLLIWIYLINSVLLVVHEIDSAYWQEWKLFKLPGGITLFLLLHLPLGFIIFYGLLLLYQNTMAGLLISLIVGLAGIFAFSIHTILMRRGHEEFKVPVSIAIIAATLVVSIVQVVVTATAMAGK